jgi:cell cycle arrest protein BUB2
MLKMSCQNDNKPFSSKIHDDAFRTFKGDADFWSKVSVEAMERVLNALSHEYGYVQGMNVLLGPFLYVMNEENSFTCMRTLLHNHIPRYVLKNLDGAHDGAKLFTKCLRLVDPKLYTHLISKIPDLSIFSLRYVLTLFANSKPLTEVLLLWDAVFAVGVHFNLLLLCAKLMLLRDALLKEKRGSK